MKKHVFTHCPDGCVAQGTLLWLKHKKDNKVHISMLHVGLAATFVLNGTLFFLAGVYVCVFAGVLDAGPTHAAALTVALAARLCFGLCLQPQPPVSASASASAMPLHLPQSLCPCPCQPLL